MYKPVEYGNGGGAQFTSPPAHHTHHQEYNYVQYSMPITDTTHHEQKVNCKSVQIMSGLNKIINKNCYVFMSV